MNRVLARFFCVRVHVRIVVRISTVRITDRRRCDIGGVRRNGRFRIRFRIRHVAGVSVRSPNVSVVRRCRTAASSDAGNEQERTHYDLSHHVSP